MKISVITPVFSIAGVPLAQIRFARALAEKGHDVDLVIGHVHQDYKFPDCSGFKVIILDRCHVRSMVLPLIKYFRSSKTEIVFSAEDHLNAVVLLSSLLAGSKAKISGSSRVTPFDTYSNRFFSKRWILKLFVRSLMWRANALTCVSKDMVAQYQKVFKNPPHVCVYNIVDDSHSRRMIEHTVEHDWFLNKVGPVLVAAGRLAPWKGFDDLIRAMKLIPEHRRARLVILGGGPMKDELQSLINLLGLQESVCLMGYVENPLKYFARADVFVLSSHVEGLPNVLVEAMMCGCTPVATDCPTGPSEVLQGGKYGYLVPMRDPGAMAAGIEKALDNPISREKLVEAVRPFERDTVISHHFEILGVPERWSGIEDQKN